MAGFNRIPLHHLLFSIHIYLVTVTSDEVWVRLVDGSSRYEGRVEVRRPVDGTWGSVCDDDWDDVDASVACRELGFHGGTSCWDACFGQGQSPTLLDGVQCDGNESSLVQCDHLGWGVHDCHNNEDAGVRFSRGVRLEGGSALHEGLLEVWRPGTTTWGTVSAETFQHQEARVLCRELGLSGGVVCNNGTCFTNHDEADLPMVLDGVRCVGNESTLLQCSHGEWKNIDMIQHVEVAGVSCYPGCQVVRLQGSTQNSYPDGIFTRTNRTCHGRPVFVSDDRTYYLYFVVYVREDFTAFWWMVGPQACVNGGGLLARKDDAIAPETITARWEQYDPETDKWVYNDNVKITCHSDCPGGSYGEKCSHDCGKCRYTTICDRHTGNCPPRDGCQLWFAGDRCDVEIVIPKITNETLVVRKTTAHIIEISWQQIRNLPSVQRGYYSYLVEYKESWSQNYIVSSQVAHKSYTIHSTVTIQDLEYNTDYDVRMVPTREMRGVVERAEPYESVRQRTNCIEPGKIKDIFLSMENPQHVFIEYTHPASVSSGCDNISSVWVDYRRHGTVEWIHEPLSINSSSYLLYLPTAGQYEIRVSLQNNAGIHSAGDIKLFTTEDSMDERTIDVLLYILLPVVFAAIFLGITAFLVLWFRKRRLSRAYVETENMLYGTTVPQIVWQNNNSTDVLHGTPPCGVIPPEPPERFPKEVDSQSGIYHELTEHEIVGNSSP